MICKTKFAFSATISSNSTTNDMKFCIQITFWSETAVRLLLFFFIELAREQDYLMFYAYRITKNGEFIWQVFDLFCTRILYEDSFSNQCNTENNEMQFSEFNRIKYKINLAWNQTKSLRYFSWTKHFSKNFINKKERKLCELFFYFFFFNKFAWIINKLKHTDTCFYTDSFDSAHHYLHNVQMRCVWVLYCVFFSRNNIYAVLWCILWHIAFNMHRFFIQ